MNNEALTPRQIVKELDKYIIGQSKAKRCVAIALRNRWRRQQVQGELRDEILPNNIIMIGPTGVGKTEIARRLAGLANAPFLKIEASKFTEVGYVGRDVESMVRDLVDIAVSKIKAEAAENVLPTAEAAAEEKLLDLLLPLPEIGSSDGPMLAENTPAVAHARSQLREKRERTREKLREKLQQGELEKKTVELDVTEERFSMMQIFSPVGLEEMGLNIQDLFGGIMPKKRKKRKATVAEARNILIQEETSKLIDMDKVITEAIERTENLGIIFIDEIDKIVGDGGGGTGPDVSREGVQRDILPVVEGTNVVTKYGLVRTDHILFIAAGAFHATKPSDLIPELQGRFPIRVELDSLGVKEFVRILTEPRNALVKQYTELMKAEHVKLNLTKDAVREIARIADQVNRSMENIGARRLHTVMTTLLEDLLYTLPKAGIREVVIDRNQVRQTLDKILEDEDLSRYIL